MFSRRQSIKFSMALVATLAAQPACSKTQNKAKSLGNADAVETARRIKSGEIRVSEALEHAIAAAEKFTAKSHALVTKTYDEARELAKSNPVGLMGGLPFAIKDLDDYHKTPTKFGSRAYKNHISTNENPLISNFDKLGILSIGKTATPEFGLTATTEPLLHPPCRNPWNLDHSSGGSSGGAGALVGAGVLKAAHASDGGGSIRIPAHSNGLVGLKTSRGRLIPERQKDPATDISVNGVLTRTVRDQAVFLAAMEDKNSGLADMGLVTGPNKRRLKIAVWTKSILGTKIEPEVIESVHKTAEVLKKLGHDVRPYDPPIPGKEVENAFMLLWSAGAAEVVSDWSKASGKQASSDYFEPWTLWLAGNFAKNKEKFPDALKTLGGLAAGFKEMVLPEFDVILSPVVASAAPKIGWLSPALEGEVHYKRVLEYVPFFSAFMNACGVPAISLPLAMSKSGLPIGMQFAAQRGDDKTLLELAFELEQAMPWINRKPKHWAAA